MNNTADSPAVEQLSIQLLEKKGQQINGEIWAMRRTSAQSVPLLNT